MKVKLSVVAGRGFRWRSMTGQAIYPPIVGRPFVLVTSKGRVVKTTKVVSLDGTTFKTASGATFNVDLLDIKALQIAARRGSA